MTRATLIRCGIAVALLGFLGTAPAADKGATEKTGGDELVKVAVLEAQNAELTKENAKLKEQIRQLQVQLAVQRVSPPAQPKVPGNWSKRDFNGIIYYVVPLDGGQSDQRPLITK